MWQQSASSLKKARCSEISLSQVFNSVQTICLVSCSVSWVLKKDPFFLDICSTFEQSHGFLPWCHFALPFLPSVNMSSYRGLARGCQYNKLLVPCEWFAHIQQLVVLTTCYIRAWSEMWSDDYLKPLHATSEFPQLLSNAIYFHSRMRRVMVVVAVVHSSPDVDGWIWPVEDLKIFQ